MTPVRPARCQRCGARLARDNASHLCAACQVGGRDALLSPPQVPLTFWQEPALQAALRSRHMGRVIRAYRTHPFHGGQGLSQGTVAGWVGITQGQLSRIETGGPIVHLDRLVQWARLLGIPPQHLWFSLPVKEQLATDDESEAVERRKFLTSTTMAAIGTLAGPSLSAFASEIPVASFLPKVVTRLGSVLLPVRPSHATSAPLTLEQLTVRVRHAWVLRQQAQYAALGELLASLIPDVEQTASAGDVERQGAVRLAVHTYNAASSLLKKLGDSALALIAADRAVRLAQSIDDSLLTAAAAYRLANVLLPAGRLDETRQIALAAANAIEPGKMQSTRSLATWGGLLLTAAVASARHGDESDAWEVLGEARAASLLLGADHADWHAIFGPTNVAIHGVQVAVELGDGRGAVRRGERLKPERMPASLLERRAQFLIDLAHAHALTGHDSDALATLLRAEHTAPQEVALSADVHRLTEGLLRQRRGSVSSELRGFATRLGVSY
jgi:transcriptional regulator with XRE-family HTH domain